MSGIALTIDANEIGDLGTAVDTLRDTLTSRDLMLVAGRSMQQTIKEHFETLSRDEAHHQSASSLGARRTGFYQEAAQSVQQPQIEGSDAVAVSINGPEGLAQRRFGGTIKGDPFLTIPARAEAYGRRAGEFDNLRLIIFPSGLGALVDRGEPAHEGTVYYWLVRQVTQEADPTVLPTDEEILDPALAAVQQQIEAVWDRQAA